MTYHKIEYIENECTPDQRTFIFMLSPYEFEIYKTLEKDGAISEAVKYAIKRTKPHKRLFQIYQ